MTARIGMAAAAAVATLLAAAAGLAAVPLTFSPADTTLPQAVSGRLSVMVTDTTNIRTIEITVTYDTTIVQSLGGGAGDLFLQSGHPLFRGFDNSQPGLWYGYCVLLGAGLSISGPGELFHWEFAGIADGTTAITAVQIAVSSVTTAWYPEVDLDPTTITIGDPVSAVPPAAGMQGLRLAPNPFNPRTTVEGDLDAAAPVRLTVHDLRGRLVAVLHDGRLDAGPFALDWDGHDLAGRTAPGGLYLFRLESGTTVEQTKGLLLK